MTGDCHVRFCERLRGETPLCLLGAQKKSAAADPQIFLFLQGLISVIFPF